MSDMADVLVAHFYHNADFAGIGGKWSIECNCDYIVTADSHSDAEAAFAAHQAAALSAAGFGPVQGARAVPTAHDTTHVVKVVCNYCDHLSYQKVKLGQAVEHECSNSPVMDPMMTFTICAWEYEAATE